MSFTFQTLLDLPGTLVQWMGARGRAYRSAIAAAFDAAYLTANLTADARSPLKCHETVLPYHAADRKIRRYTNELLTTWRKRIAKFKQIKRSSGKAYGILRALRLVLLPYGRPLLRYVHTSGDGAITEWFTLAPGDDDNDYFVYGHLDPEFTRTLAKPGNWLWDPRATTGGTRGGYWILIYTSGLTPTSSIEWDVSGEWDDGVSRWDYGLPSTIIADCAECCKDMHASNSMCLGIFQVHNDALFDPAGSGAGHPNGTWHIDTNRIGNVSYSYERIG
jgi:hypothetical protein